MSAKGTCNCLYCGKDDDSDLKYGKLITKRKITLHYFCMLFSSNLNQSGRSTRVGILGFLEKDILKEKRRGQKLRCCYCKKYGATIGCSVKKCNKRFHYPCGIEHNTMHQFFGSYASFCPKHCLKQESPASDRLAFHGTATSVCPICLCSVETRTSFQTLRTPCCKHSWIHRECLQEQAIHFGYFFRCPLCNNKDAFQVEMLTHGIYIPEQDASWEREENAFEELLFRHNSCDHAKCRCPDGRNYNKEGSRWEIILCDVCGSQGCHVACGRLSFYKSFFECQSCQKILKKVTTKSTNKRRRSGSRESRTVRRLGRSPTDPGYLKEVEDELAKRIRSYQYDVDSNCSSSSSSVHLHSAIDYCPIKRLCPNMEEDDYVEVEAIVDSDNGDDDDDDDGREITVDDFADLRLSATDFPSPIASVQSFRGDEENEEEIVQETMDFLVSSL